MDFILLLIIGTTWIWGVHCLFSDGYLLEQAGVKAWNRWPKWATKPLFICPPCMSSIHGLIIASAYFGLNWLVFGYMVCLCGLNYILKQLIYPEYE